ncbi:MAG: hypothetical protein HC906_02300 [Bacteroidales bacterium]|nr:hypothetical protein [Bacteroidales bacterium]
MPYRRLPNTDAARLRALKISNEKGKEIPPFKLAFSQSNLQKIKSFLSLFEKSMLESKQAYQKQVEKSKEYNQVLKKARLYISHFIQVINMAIMRGDLPSKEKEYYGLHDSGKLPPLNTEADIIKWGEKLIHGETVRTMQGHSPITNPTIAVVKVRYEKFLEAYKFQKMLQKNSQRAQERLDELRLQANDIIVDVWNEIEKSFEKRTRKYIPPKKW